MTIGRVEMVSAIFAFGWCEVASDRPIFVYATLSGHTVGIAEANLLRPDLERRRAAGRPEAHAFLIVFGQRVDPAQLGSIEVTVVGEQKPLPRATSTALDRDPTLQLFLLGSPRSGTSQLAKTLSDELSLPWLGEGHGAPFFAEAAQALRGDETAKGGLARLLGRQHFDRLAVEAAQRAYYFAHSSASFLDKTPGVAMIKAAQFVAVCFPDAKFIYLMRNGVSNVLSRMAKFGGRFDSHCADWAAAQKTWEQVRNQLPHFLEVRHEQMEADPAAAASRIATYLEMPGAANTIATSLSKGALERTGAGRGKPLLDQTGWNERQIAIFIELCGPTMKELGYSLRRSVTA